jgi:TPR repeat protein
VSDADLAKTGSLEIFMRYGDDKRTRGGRNVSPVSIALAGIAIYFASGLVLAQNYSSDALNCYQAAARQGQNYPELCRKAADAGDAHAMYLLGISTTNADRRIEWLQRAVGLGHPRAAYALAEVRRRRGETDLADRLDQISARAGYGPARIRIARALRADTSNPENAVTARRILLEEANAGYPFAQFLVAIMMANGEGGAANPDGASNWMFEAATAGLSAAQYRYGLSLVDSDPDAALPWLLKAARQGHVGATYALASVLATNPGNQDRLNRALYWTHLALRGGHPDAPRLLASLRGANTPGNTSNQSGNRPAAAAPVPAVQQPNLIARMQDALSRLGYDPGPVDGMMGARTRTAIRAFERSVDLSETGSPSEEVLQRMLEELGRR